jgi:hypothetical protein
MLVVNLLALIYCIDLVRRMRGRGRRTTKDSLLTELNGSLARSLADE